MTKSNPVKKYIVMECQSVNCKCETLIASSYKPKIVQPIHFIGNKLLLDKVLTINHHFDQVLTKKLIKDVVSLILLQSTVYSWFF